jgi:uncharacterized protein (DUF736 family)
MEYDNSNRGALFRVTDKQGNDKRPDYSGNLNVNGVDYELSGWMKVSKAGNKFMSLTIKEPFKKTTKVATPVVEPFEDDEIPFDSVPF